jgi:hypothetical protein
LKKSLLRNSETLDVKTRSLFREADESDQTEEENNLDAPPAHQFPILTAKYAKNSEVFGDILRLYVPPGSVIADTTFGEGYFWRNVSPDRYTVLASDIQDRWRRRRVGIRSNLTFVIADMRTLPYPGESIAAVVIDPPYGQLSSKPHKTDALSFSRAYSLETRRGEKGVEHLYLQATEEAYRVLIPHGLAIIKCQDFVNCGRQVWMHINLFSMAIERGFVGEDLFVLIQERQPMMRHDYQMHARKNHSFFWVFRKPGR